jgi:hypothetical protein
MGQGYSEAELITNRSSLILSGGGEADRRAWAEEAAAQFANEGMTEISSLAELVRALEHGKGVVFVPDAGALGYEAQGKIVHCLLNQEERPKIIVALSTSPADALAKGDLRDDLHYRLQMARVDLSKPGMKDLMRSRRAARAKADAKRPPPPNMGPRVIISKPAPRARQSPKPQPPPAPHKQVAKTPVKKGGAKGGKRR